ncbi:PAQR family membrane homeostasis protein TrhA [Paludibaculum fermentans]|uniref:PAQR family membrane homeostasis protein TrhA n=1 Tax=Paludibaculum fermentans TaxID=1473598 RepID=UPI003EBFB705
MSQTAGEAVATPGEEIASSVTHGLGAALSVAGLVMMVVAAATRGTGRQVLACAVYGSSLILLYLSSTLYHALRHQRAKRVFRILDHISIYLLIAGTYTPFLLVTLRGPWGWALFGVVWGLAVLGIGFKCFFTGRMEILSTSVYLLMGWVAVVAIRPLLAALPWTGFLWLLAGGLAYTLGVVFYTWRRKYAHAVWHLFVLAGSACHFVAVWLYVLPHAR